MDKINTKTFYDISKLHSKNEEIKSEIYKEEEESKKST